MNRKRTVMVASRVAMVIIATIGQLLPANVAAQNPKPANIGPVPLARFVPATAPFYLNIRRLTDVDRALSRTNAWPVLRMIGGAPASAPPVDLRQIVSRFIGPRSTINVNEVIQTEIGAVMSSEFDWSTAVWLIRVPDDKTMERWFPKQRRIEGKKTQGLSFFRTDDGVIAAVRDGIAVMARQPDKAPLFREAIALMTEQRADSLDRNREYQDIISYLPQRELGTIYWKPDPSNKAVALLSVFQTVERMALRVFEGDGKIDLAVRAATPRSQRGEKVSAGVLSRMAKLPQTTVFATAAKFDALALLRDDGESKSKIDSSIKVLVQGLLGGAGANEDLAKQLGSNVIVAWEPDLRRDRTTPQVALMLECEDSRHAGELIGSATLNAARFMAALGGISGESLAVRESTHLGTTIRSVSLSSLSDYGEHPFLKLVGGAEPAWAVWGSWLIVAVHRGQIERILDAQNGLSPSLESAPDVTLSFGERTDLSQVSFVRPGLAANIIERWLADCDAGAPSLLETSTWLPSVTGDEAARSQLGIGMKANQQPGLVVVARVYPDSNAAGLIEPGDVIIGIDGKLLDMQTPNNDLRRRWNESKADPGPMIRLIRGDQTLEVVVRSARVTPLLPDVLMKPVDALRELVKVGHALQSASIAVSASDENHFTAKASLRFAPPPPPGPPVTVGATP